MNPENRFGSIDVSTEEGQSKFDELTEGQKEDYIKNQHGAALEVNAQIGTETSALLLKAQLTKAIDEEKAKEIFTSIKGIASDKIDELSSAENSEKEFNLKEVATLLLQGIDQIEANKKENRGNFQSEDLVLTISEATALAKYLNREVEVIDDIEDEEPVYLIRLSKDPVNGDVLYFFQDGSVGN